MNRQIVFAGVGGQGILFVSKLFSELGLKLGLDILGSETHGMSQRGGSVVAHLKLGKHQSPMIRTGSADILYSFEEKETYRNLRFLRRGGLCFVNLRHSGQFHDRIRHHLEAKNITIKTCDATGVALKIGFVRSANIVLIGYSMGTGLIPFQYEDLKSALESVSRTNDRLNNLTAFEKGFHEGQTQR